MHLDTRSLLFAVEEVDYTADVSRVELLAVEGRDRAIGEADFEHGGMREYRLSMTSAQDTAGNSLWSMGQNQASELVAFYLAPYGNWAASVDQPHHSGTALVVGPAGTVLGGSAAPSRNTRFTTDMVWVVIGTPELITEGAYPADLPDGW